MTTAPLTTGDVSVVPLKSAHSGVLGVPGVVGSSAIGVNVLSSVSSMVDTLHCGLSENIDCTDKHTVSRVASLTDTSWASEELNDFKGENVGLDESDIKTTAPSISSCDICDSVRNNVEGSIVEKSSE